MKALIAGASGLVGGNCLKLLLADNDYTEVISIGRRELDISNDKLKQEIVDFNELGFHDDLFEGVDHVYCCLGTTIKVAGSKENFKKVDLHYPLSIAKYAEERGAKVFSIISSMGASSNSSIFYNQVKGEVEDKIAIMDFRLVNILRPSLLLGERQESRLGESIGKAAMSLFNPLMKGRLKAYKAISGEQVAKAMVQYTKQQDFGVKTYTSDQLWTE